MLCLCCRANVLELNVCRCSDNSGHWFTRSCARNILLYPGSNCCSVLILLLCGFFLSAGDCGSELCGFVSYFFFHCLAMIVSEGLSLLCNLYYKVYVFHMLWLAWLYCTTV